MTKTIAVIGAGFCGTMIACELARASVPDGLVIALVDDRSQFARGVAYQCNNEGWLLNARAAHLGAVSGQPGDFSRFCREIGIDPASDTFIPRAVYGAYLEDLLDRTAASTLRHRLYRVYARAESIGAGRDGARAEIRLDNGQALRADHVVLATGAVSRQAEAKAEFKSLGERYLHDPWNVHTLYDSPPGTLFAVLGTGLTALDVVSSLRRHVRQARFHLVSRRGLLPLPHGGSTANVPGVDLAALLESSARGGVTDTILAVRRVAALYQSLGGDWRDVIDRLRPAVPGIWRSWSTRQKKQFVEHAAPYWDVHRHRCPASTNEMLQALREEGRLTIEAARLLNVRAAGEQVELVTRRRHEHQAGVMRADYLINCTGAPSGLLQNPLLVQLRNAGLATADEFGLRVDDQYRLLDTSGEALDWLSYVGPLLKGKFWEVTAIPELRVHVEQLIARLSAQFSEPVAVAMA